jgi:hypothetical protein
VMLGPKTQGEAPYNRDLGGVSPFDGDYQELKKGARKPLVKTSGHERLSRES